MTRRDTPLLTQEDVAIPIQSPSANINPQTETEQLACQQHSPEAA